MIIAITDVIELNSELHALGYSKLPKYRKAKVDRLKNIEDKRRSVAAGILLNAAVRQYVNSNKYNNESSNNAGSDDGHCEIHLVDIKEAVEKYDAEYDYEIDYCNNGKPCFKNGACQFNLSHAGRYAVCVVSACEVGVDIEGDRTCNDKVARRFFTEGECEWIYKTKAMEEDKDISIVAKMENKDSSYICSDNQDMRFFRIWTLKEAYSKVTGKGIAYGINEAEFEVHNIEKNTEKNIKKNIKNNTGTHVQIADRNEDATSGQWHELREFNEQQEIRFTDSTLDKQYGIVQLCIDKHVISVVYKKDA